MEHLNDSSLFDSMYAEDSEGQKLNTMPQIKEMVDEYPLHTAVKCDLSMHVLITLARLIGEEF